MPSSLDLVVTSVATRLMAATAATTVGESTGARDLVEYFDVDVSFLRHNDHEMRASVLVTEWPHRPDVPDPDPLAVVYFADADPVFALSEDAKKPMVFRPEPATDEYQRTIEDGRQVPTTSMAAAPLMSGDLTTGVLGFVKFGDREWTRRTQRARGDHHPVRSAAGRIDRRRTAALPRRARRPDRRLQSPRAAGTSDARLQPGSQGPCRRCSSTWTG